MRWGRERRSEERMIHNGYCRQRGRSTRVTQEPAHLQMRYTSRARLYVT